MRGASEVRFARVGLKAKRSGQRCFCGRQSGGSMVSCDQEIKLVVCVAQLAVSKKESGIARQSLVEQIYRLKNAFTTHRAKSCAKQEILRAAVEIKRGDVVCRGTLDRALFARRKLSLELVSNRLCDLALNGEHIREIAIVSLRPKMRVISCIDQLRINAHAIGCALYAALEHMRHSKFFADFAQIAFYAALIVHHA